MGLPIWSDRSEALNAAKTDSTAAARSSIRRASSIRRTAPPARLRRTDSGQADPLADYAPSIAQSLQTLHNMRPRSRRGLEAEMAMPPLRRMSRRSIATELQPSEPTVTVQVAELNGLGDRRRSLTPQSEPAAETWSLFGSTIAPDPSVPGASTSFQRNADTAGDASARAAPTDTSAGGLMQDLLTDNCDLPSPVSDDSSSDDCDDDFSELSTASESQPRSIRDMVHAGVPWFRESDMANWSATERLRRLRSFVTVMLIRLHGEMTETAFATGLQRDEAVDYVHAQLKEAVDAAQDCNREMLQGPAIGPDIAPRSRS